MPYTIEPQRDFYEGRGTEYDPDETWFVPCDDEHAEMFAVFEVSDPDAYWIDDFASRFEAEFYIEKHS